MHHTLRQYPEHNNNLLRILTNLNFCDAKQSYRDHFITRKSRENSDNFGCNHRVFS
jgi:hypothetical protein